MTAVSTSIQLGTGKTNRAKETPVKLAIRLVVCCGAIVGWAALVWPAQEKSVRPGINKPFENPDLKDFVKKFEGESREIAAHAKEIVAACKIKPGMVVADVGAGTGLFTRRFAAEVGEKGKVFAVDIAPTFLRHIEKTCEDNRLKNVETIQCDQFSTKLPRNSVDLVFICDTYHHFEFPHRTLQSIHEALRPAGKIILIDFHRIEGKSSEFVLGHVRAGQGVFVREVKSAGFNVVGEEKFLKENYFVRFEKHDAIKKDRKQIEGTWRVVALEVNGNKVLEEDAKKLTVVNGADGTWSLLSEGTEISKGTSTIDPTKKPKTIDFTPTDGEAKGKLHLGIYELREKTRKLCFAPSGKDRPAEFASMPGSEHILVTFEREKSK
jgi:FkbM family methyltransferase